MSVLKCIACMGGIYYGCRACFKKQPVAEQNRDLLMVIISLMAGFIT